MRHFLLSGVQVRVGVIRGQFCYQPFVAGRLGKAVPLFPDLGTPEANHEFFEAHFEPVVNENGDFYVVARPEIRRYRE